MVDAGRKALTPPRPPPSPPPSARSGKATYRVYQGSRAEVDAQYKGCMTSLKEVKPSAPLGARIA